MDSKEHNWNSKGPDNEVLDMFDFLFGLFRKKFPEWAYNLTCETCKASFIDAEKHYENWLKQHGTGRVKQ